MSWGTKIVLVFAVFVSGMLYMVFKAGSYNTDLVTSDYYEQELVYQKTIDAVEQANALSAPPSFVARDQQVLINLPPEMHNKKVKSAVWLYCVADKSRDLRKEFETTEGYMVMPFMPGNKGLHEIKLTWSVDGQTFYYRHKIIL